MVERQLRRRGIADVRVLDAMGEFLGSSSCPRAPRACVRRRRSSIGHGQTISQPFIVATICSLLELEGDERVLDVGTGSGYQAAVLAELAAEVVTIERVPELAESARAALGDAGYPDVDVRVGDGSLGVPDRAPFDAIAVAAAAPTIPQALYASSQREGGSSSRAARAGAGPRARRADAGRPGRAPSVPCRFVPLVGDQGFGHD